MTPAVMLLLGLGMGLPGVASAADHAFFPDIPPPMHLLSGVMLFLYGLARLSEAVKLLTGERMREVVGRLTTHRLMAFLLGMGMTAAILSSAATVSMLVGFVSAQLLSFAQTMGVILGASVGSSLAAQLLAFPLSPYAPAAMAAGFLLQHLARGERLPLAGQVILGLGLVFLGMGEMGAALTRMPHPLWMVDMIASPTQTLLMAALLSALLRSNTAVVGGAMTLGAVGALPLENALFLVLGANLGSVVAPHFSAHGKRREALRVAVAHTLLRVLGVLTLIAFLPQLAQLCRWLVPVIDPADAAARAAALPRQMAHAHLLFNLLLAGVFLPLSGFVVALCERLVPDPPHRDEFLDSGSYTPRYLDPSLLNTPALALGMMRRETSLMCDILERMIAEAPEAVLNGDVRKMEILRKLDDQVDEIHEAVTRYLSRMSALPLPPHIADEVLAAMAATAEMEAVGDIIENNLAHLAQVCSREQLIPAPEVQAALTHYHKGVLQAFKSACTAFISDDREAAEMVLGMKEGVHAMDESCRQRQMLSLQDASLGGGERPLAAYALHMDVRENLKRIYYHTRRVAKLVLRESDPLWPLSRR